MINEVQRSAFIRASEPPVRPVTSEATADAPANIEDNTPQIDAPTLDDTQRYTSEQGDPQVEEAAARVVEAAAQGDSAVAGGQADALEAYATEGALPEDTTEPLLFRMPLSREVIGTHLDSIPEIVELAPDLRERVNDETHAGRRRRGTELPRTDYAEMLPENMPEIRAELEAQLDTRLVRGTPGLRENIELGLAQIDRATQVVDGAQELETARRELLDADYPYSEFPTRREAYQEQAARFEHVLGSEDLPPEARQQLQELLEQSNASVAEMDRFLHEADSDVLQLINSVRGTQLSEATPNLPERLFEQYNNYLDVRLSRGTNSYRDGRQGEEFEHFNTTGFVQSLRNEITDSQTRIGVMNDIIENHLHEGWPAVQARMEPVIARVSDRARGEILDTLRSAHDAEQAQRILRQAQASAAEAAEIGGRAAYNIAENNPLEAAQASAEMAGAVQTAEAQSRAAEDRNAAALGRIGRLEGRDSVLPTVEGQNAQAQRERTEGAAQETQGAIAQFNTQLEGLLAQQQSYSEQSVELAHAELERRVQEGLAEAAGAAQEAATGSVEGLPMDATPRTLRVENGAVNFNTSAYDSGIHRLGNFSTRVRFQDVAGAAGPHGGRSSYSFARVESRLPSIGETGRPVRHGGTGVDFRLFALDVDQGYVRESDQNGNQTTAFGAGGSMNAANLALTYAPETSGVSTTFNLSPLGVGSGGLLRNVGDSDRDGSHEYEVTLPIPFIGPTYRLESDWDAYSTDERRFMAVPGYALHHMATSGAAQLAQSEPVQEFFENPTVQRVGGALIDGVRSLPGGERFLGHMARRAREETEYEVGDSEAKNI